MPRKLKLTNVGPIAALELTAPDSGLLVLKARNGRGKTSALEAIESAITGQGKLPVRDGALRAEVEAFGVTLTVGRKAKRSGELEVTSLHGRLDVGHLVDPGLKSPEAADAQRIKALIQIAGVRPSTELFAGLFRDREEFERIVPPAAGESADLPTMAGIVKRSLEAAARSTEGAAEHAMGRAKAAEAAAGDTRVDALPDREAAQDTLSDAIATRERIRADERNAIEARRRWRTAKDALEDATLEHKGPTVAQADADVKQAAAHCTEAETAVRAAQEALRVAESDAKAATIALRHATAIRSAAAEHAKALEGWQAIVDAPLPAQPDPQDVMEADLRVELAHEAVSRAVIVHEALRHHAARKTALEEAAALRSQADRLRNAAGGVDEILSECVSRAGTPLRVEAGRLICDTHRGPTLFAELSQGERWRMALDVAIERVGEAGCIPISQECFEGLDPQNRAAIAKHLADRGALGITAEASGDDEIVTETLP